MLALGLLAGSTLVRAQNGDSAKDEKAVQVLNGKIDLGGGLFYLLPDLKESQMLYVYAKRTSGNLDPFIGLSRTRHTSEDLSQAFEAEVLRVIAEGQDPLVAVPAIYDEFLDVWDDDSGDGYDATFAFRVPADGEYQLLVSDSPTKGTFGEYRLQIGLNTEQVLKGSASSTGAEIAVFDAESARMGAYVQEITGTLTTELSEQTLTLGPVEEGDTLYAYVEGSSWDLAPAMILRDYGEKPLRSANLSFAEPNASFMYRFEETDENYTLKIAADRTQGDYRLLVGLNAPEVMTGEAEPTLTPVLKMPIEVSIGMQLQQLTDVDQVAENFGAVASLMMRWQDPALSFSPDTCRCNNKVFTGDSFSKFAEANEIDWPQFTLVNQQGNRWVQNRNVVIKPDGTTTYSERFTTDFQAPLFDFTQFPFDVQQLYMEVGSLYRSGKFTFVDAPEFSGIGEVLGEEEWSVSNSEARVGIEDDHANYVLAFQVHRYLTFYIFRIIVPIILIIIVAWFTFFLQDFGKRVDVSGANLLVFVAFNFTVSNELPRLGYLTFMDAILIGTFVISAAVVAYCVFLKRLEIRGKRDTAEKIDKYAIWVYPVLYMAGAALAYILFLA